MNRREVLAGIMLPLVPRAALAQPAILPVVTFVSPSQGAGATRYLEAIRRGLQEAGIVEGRDATIEQRHVEVAWSNCRRLWRIWSAYASP